MRKKLANWTDNLASSTTPTDEFSYSTGNNFGLDGFQFDTPYNEGVEDGGRLPSTRGMSALPDGLVTSSEDDGVTYDSLMASDSGVGDALLMDKEASLIDLEWLDPMQDQDPSRLPDKNKALNSIPELERAWSSYKPQTVVPNVDREAASYRASLHDKMPTPKTAKEIEEVGLKALRMAHAGVSIREIKEMAVGALGHEAGRLAPILPFIEKEGPLLGRTYILASAFPGIEKGKWDKTIRKFAAQYIVAKDANLAQVLCQKFSKKVASSWDEVFEHYAPRLKAAGFVVPKKGTPKERLKAAFLQGPRVVEADAGYLPVDKTPVSFPEHKAAVFKTTAEVQADRQQVEVKAKIAQWVKKGSLKQSEAIKILMSGASSQAQLAAANAIRALPKKAGSYEGVGTQISEDAQLQRQMILSSLEDSARKVQAALKMKAAKRLAAAVREGTLTMTEAKRIVALSKTAGELEQYTAFAIQHADQMHRTEMKPIKASKYQGPVQAEAQLNRGERAVALSAQMERVLKVASQAGAQAKDVIGLLKWAKTHMLKGASGPKLDALLSQRFSPRLLKASEQLLRELRALHEIPYVAEASPPPAPLYDPSEFNLGNTHLESITLQASQKESPLKDITFGGMEI